MSEAKQVREMVSKVYAKAVEGKDDCCAPSCCGPSMPIPKGVAAKVAGYEGETLASLPADAVESSFGCGNPLAFSEVQPGEVVVDLGSGAGIDLLIAAQKVGPEGRVIGVDMTDEMIAHARKNIEASGHDNIEVRKGIIEALPVEDASVDWVISNCVINLSPEKDKVFGEIARTLRPGGKMLVSDIVVQDLPEWARTSGALYAACVAGAIDEESYLNGLRNAGLVDVEVRQRLVYDESQIAGLIRSELSDDVKALLIAQSFDPETMPEQIAAQLSGKVWSASIYARKPAA